MAQGWRDVGAALDACDNVPAQFPSGLLERKSVTIALAQRLPSPLRDLSRTRIALEQRQELGRTPRQHERSVRDLNNYMVPFDNHRIGFCDEGALSALQRNISLRICSRVCRLHSHVVAPDPHPLRIKPRLTCSDVEFPTMPRTAQDLSVAGQTVISRLGRGNESTNRTLAEWPALMGTPVSEGKEFAANIENTD